MQKITSCVTSVLSWNTKCAISSKPGRTLHRGVLGDRLELMAFVRKAEELSYVALCSCGMERSRAEGEQAGIDEARRCFEQLDVLRVFLGLDDEELCPFFTLIHRYDYYVVEKTTVTEEHSAKMAFVK